MDTMTDIERVDRALFAYLQAEFSDVVFAPTSKARKTIVKKTSKSNNPAQEEKIPWTFVSLYRSPQFEMDYSRYNYPANMRGVQTRSISGGTRNPKFIESDKNQFVMYIPVNLTYQIDLWAATNSRVQEMAIKLLSKIEFTNKIIEVQIDPNAFDSVDDPNVDTDEPHKARMHIDDFSWSDNSDIESEEQTGKFYRHTMSIKIRADFTLTRENETPSFGFALPPIDIYDPKDIDADGTDRNLICTDCDWERLDKLSKSDKSELAKLEGKG